MATLKKGDPYLGSQIRKKREQKTVTLTQAAREINISPSLLSQIETGVTSPSISTLRAIADYLDTPIGILLNESISKENFAIIRKNNKGHPIIQGKGVKFQILTPSNSNLEFMYDEYDANSSTGDKLYQHDGEECGFVLKGKLEIILNDKKFVLNEGDFIWFQSAIPHKMKNLSGEETITIWVDTPPRF
jgi:transcriptional regulator with XRE-family HTH domain